MQQDNNNRLKNKIYKYYLYEIIAVSITIILFYDNFTKARNSEYFLVIIIFILAVLYLALKIFLLKRNKKNNTLVNISGIIEKKHSKYITPLTYRLFFRINGIDFEVSMKQYAKHFEGDMVEITIAETSSEILQIIKLPE